MKSFNDITVKIHTREATAWETRTQEFSMDELERIFSTKERDSIVSELLRELRLCYTETWVRKRVALYNEDKV